MSGIHTAISIQTAPNPMVKSLAYNIHFFSVRFLFGTMFLYMIVDQATSKLSTDDIMTARMLANQIPTNRLFGMISCISENIAVLGFIHFRSVDATNHKNVTIPSKNNINGSDR